MVVISHPRLIASRMAGRLDAPNKARFQQDVQIVVHGLRRERAKPLAGSVRNGVRISMPSFALDRYEYGEPECSHPKSGPAQGFVQCGFV